MRDKNNYKPNYDIICFGSNTVDSFIYTDAELIEIKAPGFHESLLAYPFGTKLLIKEFQIEIGGGGTNTAVAFSRLGLKTAYFGAIGRDENSIRVIKLLEKEQVDFIGKIKDVPTGFSIILDSFEKDRTILTYKGANDHISYSDFPKIKAKWYYFSSLTGKSFVAMKQIWKFAKQHKIKIAFNPSMYQVKNLSLDDLVDIDVLIFNLEEAKQLVFQDSKKDVEIKKIFEKLNFIPVVVITNGKEGAFAKVNLGSNHRLKSINPNLMNTEDKVYWIKSHKIKVVETTGAGDAFASGFVFGIIKHHSLKDALKIALLEAESVIKHRGAKNKLLKNSELKKLLSKSKFEIKSF